MLFVQTSSTTIFQPFTSNLLSKITKSVWITLYSLFNFNNISYWESMIKILFVAPACWKWMPGKNKKTSIYIIPKEFDCPFIFENMGFLHLYLQCVHVVVDFYVCFNLLVFFSLRHLVAKWIIDCINNCATEHGLNNFLHNCSYSVSLAIEHLKLHS